MNPPVSKAEMVFFKNMSSSNTRPDIEGILGARG